MDIPEHWGLAPALVWIAVRDHAAFSIPAGKPHPKKPARDIFTATARPVWHTRFPNPIPLAEHYS